MMNGSMRASAGLLSLGLALVGAAACGDDTATEPTPQQHPGDAIAEARCARYDACCPGGAPVVGSGAECVEELGAAYRAQIDDGGGEGWDFDQRCVDAAIALYGGITCDEDPAVARCTIDWCWGGFHHGTAAAGATCSDARDCDINLDCVEGACRNPCGLGEGEPCGASAVDPDVQTCSPLYVCDLQSSTCRPLPPAGQPCLTNRCQKGVACIEGTCEAPRPEGAPCPDDPACASSYCAGGSGTCSTRPGVGEPCSVGGCDLASRCVDGTCQPLPGDGEPCPELECAEGFACADGVCVVSIPVLCAG